MMEFGSESIVDKFRTSIIRGATTLAIEIHTSSAVLEYGIIIPPAHDSNSKGN